MIAVIDYQLGNIKSVANALEDLGEDVLLTHLKEEIDQAEKIVFPGVGAFGEGMEHLIKLGLVEILEENVLRKKKPFLGICLGMQLLADIGYEFGQFRGLGWIPGKVKRLETGDLPLPHVGWNDLKLVRESSLVGELPDHSDFYFLHSFHFTPDHDEHIVAKTDYGESFVSIVSRENIFGVQFHPEKSQKAGKMLLENFIKL